MNLNKSKTEILKDDNTTNTKNKATLLYTECRHTDHSTEVAKKWILLIKKTEIHSKENKPKISEKKNNIYSSIWIPESNLPKNEAILNNRDREYERKRNLELYLTT